MPGQALITGASSGLGAEFARQLARDNYDLILVARRREKMEILAREIRETNGVQITILPADLSQLEDLARLETAVSKMSVDMLINNAGFGLNHEFRNIPTKRLIDMLRVHLEATVRLTKAVLPNMLDRRQGTIINVASTAAFAPGPGSAIYPASKAFLVSFSQSLAREVSEIGIKVQGLCPGFTYTDFHDTREYENFDRSVVPGFLWMTAEEVVSFSLRSLSGRKVIVIPGFWNRVGISLINFPLTRPLFWKIYRDRRKKFRDDDQEKPSR